MCTVSGLEKTHSPLNPCTVTFTYFPRLPARTTKPEEVIVATMRIYGTEA